jgi:phosphoglucosamine mutase
MKSIKLFGTDGIRAEVDSFPLDKNSLIILGNVIGNLYSGSKILIGRDTRESGVRIERDIFKGLASFTKVYSAGILPTPALSYLIKEEGFELGIMITASHNPFNYNGIKIFKRNGEKISNEEENRIEEEFFKSQSINIDIKKNIIFEKFDLNSKYVDYIKNLYESESLLNEETLDTKVVVDSANGAFSFLVEKVFERMGFKDIIYINNKPNGTNINENCGALYTDNLAEKVKKENADLGVAFDGDGDRLICVDKDGFVLNGDYLLLMISRFFVKKNKSKVVVGTIMSNLGLEKALQKSNLKLIRADVGDKNVYKEMKRYNASVGGEQSGHIIIEGNNTGDGLISFLYFLASIKYLRISFESVKYEIETFPQILKNYEIKTKTPIKEWFELKNAIDEFEAKYGGNARIVIRYSGTEPLIRVMIESAEQRIIDENIKKFETIITENN